MTGIESFSTYQVFLEHLVQGDKAKEIYGAGNTTTVLGYMSRILEEVGEGSHQVHSMRSLASATSGNCAGVVCLHSAGELIHLEKKPCISKKYSEQ